MKSYLGKLLAANPSNPKDSLERSVILVVSQSERISLGLQINKPSLNFDLSEVCDQMGIYVDSTEPVYYGGNVTPNKIHIIHSNDWTGLTTIPITEEISLTNDISVLTAISRNQGPEYFKACAGFWGWEPEKLESQIESKNDYEVLYRWEYVSATPELVFGNFERNQYWEMVIEAAAREQVSHWL